MTALERTAAALGALSIALASAHAEPAFINGLLLEGAALGASDDAVVNDGRLGFFSDIRCDHARNEWWALCGRGPGCA